MNKKFQKIVALSLLFSMIIVNVSFAQENNVIKKSETVYVTVDGDEIKDKTVSVWLNSDKNIKVKDKSNLKEVKNLKTDEKVLGKNGYSIEFNSNGYAYRICKDGVPQTGLSNTENWINVYNLRIFWSGMQDTTDIFSIENTPQIGVDGPMSSTSKINLGRSTASGENKLAGTSGLFVRIQGQDGSYWIHDGRLTALTDENLNYTY